MGYLKLNTTTARTIANYLRRVVPHGHVDTAQLVNLIDQLENAINQIEKGTHQP